jgi:hypothetical protein
MENAPNGDHTPGGSKASIMFKGNHLYPIGYARLAWCRTRASTTTASFSGSANPASSLGCALALPLHSLGRAGGARWRD